MNDELTQRTSDEIVRAGLAVIVAMLLASPFLATLALVASVRRLVQK